MKSSDFFETSYDFTDSYNLALTDTWSNLSVSDMFSDAYYLGWISYNNLPPSWRFSRATLQADATGTTTGLTFEIANAVGNGYGNYDVGYAMSKTSNSSSTNTLVGVYWIDDSSTTLSVSYGHRNTPQYINQIDCMSVGAGSFNLTIIQRVASKDGGVNYDYTGSYASAVLSFGSASFATPNNILDFLDGTESLSNFTVKVPYEITVGTDTVTGEQTIRIGTQSQMQSTDDDYLDEALNINDMDEYGIITLKGSTTITTGTETNTVYYQIQFAIIGAFATATSYINESGNTINAKISAMVKTPLEDDNGDVHDYVFVTCGSSPLYNESTNVYYMCPYLIYNKGTGKLSVSSSMRRGAFYGFENQLYTMPCVGTLSSNTLTNTDKSIGFEPEGNMLLLHTTTSIYIYVPLFADDIRKVVAMVAPRLVTGTNQYGYAENDVWATYVTSEEEFTATLVTGELTSQGYLNKSDGTSHLLREWQYNYTEWENNDYEPDDKPQYTGTEEPDKVTNDDPTITGDDIERPTAYEGVGLAGFITQYALHESNLRSLANSLWANYGTDAFWESFIPSFFTSGSFQISALLDYFLSLQVYPFALNNLSSYTTGTQNMYIGAGTVPLINDYNLGKIDQLAASLGTYTTTFIPYFNDYRDFTETSISMYLPFCGVIDIDPVYAFESYNGQTHGNNVTYEYVVDLLTGNCTCYVDITAYQNDHVFSTYAVSGKLSCSVPLSAGNASQMVTNLAKPLITSGYNALVATGNNIPNTFANATQSPVAPNAVKGMAFLGGVSGDLASNAVMEIPKIASDYASMSPIQPRKLIMPSTADMWGAVRFPYIEYKRGRYNTSNLYGSSIGYKFYSSYNLGSIGTGSYVKCINPDLSGITATNTELMEIKQWLESGVYA